MSDTTDVSEQTVEQKHRQINYVTYKVTSNECNGLNGQASNAPNMLSAV